MPVIKSRKVRKTSRKIVKKSLRKTSRKPVRKSLKKTPMKTVRKSLKKTPMKTVRKSLRMKSRKASRKPVRKSMKKTSRKPLRKSAKALSKFREMMSSSKSKLYKMENSLMTPTKQSNLLPKASEKSLTPFTRTPIMERLYPGRNTCGVLGITALERPSILDWEVLDKK